MTRAQFIVFMILMFTADWLFQRFAPGVFWFAPAALISAAAVRNIGRIMFLLVAVFLDLFSGIPFGWVTLALAVVCGIMMLMRRWVLVPGLHALFFGIYSLAMAAVFGLLLSYPVGMRTILHQLPLFVVQSVAPLIIAAIAHPPQAKKHAITYLHR